MSSTSTTSIIRGAVMRFMLLLLPCWGQGGRIATLQIQERQDRRWLIRIEHIHLFYCREEFAHRLQIEAAPRHLRRLTIFCEQRVKTRHVTLGRIGAVDCIPLGLGDSALSLPTLARHFLIKSLNCLIGLA